MRELTLAEAAALIGRSPTTLRHQVQRGKLRARLVGKTYVVTARELTRYAERNRRGRLGAAVALRVPAVPPGDFILERDSRGQQVITPLSPESESELRAAYGDR